MRKIYRQILATFKPKPRLSISQWSDQFRYIARGTGPEPGRWKTARAPYTREIMDVFNSPENMVVVMASSQVGKTEIALNIMGYYMVEDPSPIMYLMPTDGMANDFSKTRVETTIQATPVLRNLFSNSKDSDNTIELKKFTSGYLAIYGAQSPTKLSSKAIRILIADEIDRFLDVLKKEGAPFKLALQRTTNFWNRKVLAISTPTIKEKSQIVELFEKSDKRYYHVPCPDCSHEFVLNWEQVKWELDDKGELIIDSVFLECPACYFHIMDKHKSELLANGKWIATAKHKTMPGFHISSLYSPWVKFHELAKEYLEIGDSEGNEKMQEFLNLKLGEPIEAIVEDLDIALLESHKLVYNAELPDGVLYLTCGVDVQDNRLEYQIIGWGENNQCWVITNQMILGNLEQDEVWDSLDGIICRGYSLPDGRKLPIGASCVDSGYLADRVYKFTTPREHLRVAAVKGFGGEGIPIINNPSSKNRTHTKVMKFGVDAAKAVIYSRLRNHTKGKNYIHFPLDITHGCGDEYYKQLNSERRVLDLKHGVKRFIWKKIRDRNEALDTFVYALAAYEMAAPNLEYIKEQLANQQFETDDDDDADGEENLISSGIKLY